MSSKRPVPDRSDSSDRPRAKRLPLIGTGQHVFPSAVPARMLNEVTYCERLMYLEWVQHEFADNHFTVEGRAVHERADASGGTLPEPPESRDPADRVEQDDDELPYQARSVWLTSERLGLTAKVDIVESDDNGRVIPIEYKRGSAPDLPEGAYLPERVQLCAHVLLLRDHGYECDHAEIYFAKSKRRVSIAITESLIQRTHFAARVAREVAAQIEAPAPLVDSPKCRGCSLSEICLPDEVNFLRRLDGHAILDTEPDDGGLTGSLEPDPWGLATSEEGSEPKPVARRLYAALDDRVPLYVHEPGAQIGLSGERLVVRGESGAVHVRLMNTSQVVVRGNVQVTTQASRVLMERGIPLIFLTGGGWYSGRLVGTDTNNIDLRVAQFQTAQDEPTRLRLARAFVNAKIRNARTLLRRNASGLDEVVLRQLRILARKSSTAESIDSLLGYEGAAAREYFQAFTRMLKAAALREFDFESRNRRPPRDPINALLSFAYALLTKELVIATSAVGLEPLLGYFHRPRFGRPALALDLMEEFRPIIADSVVLTAVNNEIISAEDFTTVAGTCSLKSHARKNLIEAHERRMDQTVIHPAFKYAVSYRRVLEVQARLLSRVLLGDIADYPAFVTR